MGGHTILSDHDGLFSLDMSQHGGCTFSTVSDANVRAAELQGKRLADFAQSTTSFEAKVTLSFGHQSSPFYVAASEVFNFAEELS